MLMSWRRSIVLPIVALTGGAILCFCGNNIYHQRYASGMVTMAECLECHDDKSDKAISICLGNNCLYTKNHSLMHPYPPPGREKDFAAVSAIEQAGCMLENGNITCLSCHNLTRPSPHLVREGHQLCLICHIDK